MSKLSDDFESSICKINTTNRENGKTTTSFMISDEISTNCYSNEKQSATIKQKLENIEIPEEEAAAEKNQREIQIKNENADIINREINYDEGKRADRNDYTDPSSKSILIRCRKFFNRGGSDISFNGGGRSDRKDFPTTWDVKDSSNITDPNSGYEKHHRKKKQQKRKSKLLSPFNALRKYFLKSLIPSKSPRFDESNNNNVQDDGNNGISVENGINATCSVPAVNKLNVLLHKTNDAIVDENDANVDENDAVVDENDAIVDEKDAIVDENEFRHSAEVVNDYLDVTKIRNNIKMPNYLLLPSKIPMKIDSAYHHHRRLNSSDFSKLINGPNKIIQADRPQITDENDDNGQMCQTALDDNDDKHWILSMGEVQCSDRVKLNYYNDDDAKMITTDVDGFVSNGNKSMMKCGEPMITVNFAIEQQVLDEVGSSMYDSLQLLNDDDYLCANEVDEYLSDRYLDEFLKRRDDDSNKTQNAEQTEEQIPPNESSPVEHKAKIRSTKGKRTTEIVDDDRHCSKKDGRRHTFVSSSRIPIPRSCNLKSQQPVATVANLKDQRIRDDDKITTRLASTKSENSDEYNGKVPANNNLKMNDHRVDSDLNYPRKTDVAELITAERIRRVFGVEFESNEPDDDDRLFRMIFKKLLIEIVSSQRNQAEYLQGEKDGIAAAVQKNLTYPDAGISEEEGMIESTELRCHYYSEALMGQLKTIENGIDNLKLVIRDKLFPSFPSCFVGKSVASSSSQKKTVGCRSYDIIDSCFEYSAAIKKKRNPIKIRSKKSTTTERIGGSQRVLSKFGNSKESFAKESTTINKTRRRRPRKRNCHPNNNNNNNNNNVQLISDYETDDKNNAKLKSWKNESDDFKIVQLETHPPVVIRCDNFDNVYHPVEIKSSDDGNNSHHKANYDDLVQNKMQVNNCNATDSDKKNVNSNDERNTLNKAEDSAELGDKKNANSNDQINTLNKAENSAAELDDKKNMNSNNERNTLNKAEDSAELGDKKNANSNDQRNTLNKAEDSAAELDDKKNANSNDQRNTLNEAEDGAQLGDKKNANSNEQRNILNKAEDSAAELDDKKNMNSNDERNTLNKAEESAELGDKKNVNSNDQRYTLNKAEDSAAELDDKKNVNSNDQRNTLNEAEDGAQLGDKKNMNSNDERNTLNKAEDSAELGDKKNVNSNDQRYTLNKAEESAELGDKKNVNSNDQRYTLNKAEDSAAELDDKKSANSNDQRNTLNEAEDGAQLGDKKNMNSNDERNTLNKAEDSAELGDKKNVNSNDQRYTLNKAEESAELGDKKNVNSNDQRYTLNKAEDSAAELDDKKSANSNDQRNTLNEAEDGAQLGDKKNMNSNDERNTLNKAEDSAELGDKKNVNSNDQRYTLNKAEESAELGDKKNVNSNDQRYTLNKAEDSAAELDDKKNVNSNDQRNTLNEAEDGAQLGDKKNMNSNEERNTLNKAEDSAELGDKKNVNSNDQRYTLNKAEDGAAELDDKKNANSNNDQRNTLNEAEDDAELGKNVTIKISKIPRFYQLNITADHMNFHPKPSRTLIGKYKTKIPILTNNNVSVTNVNPNIHKLLPNFGKEHRTEILLPTIAESCLCSPRDVVELFDKIEPIAPKLIDRNLRPKPKSRCGGGSKRFIRTNRQNVNGNNAEKSIQKDKLPTKKPVWR